ncbi:Leo1-like protein-domain-containing protein [Hygrophoropsis aurantiaca]|uniref:Leo1-like protein-domain-containing protein n=1 Tax=Hygrophoropsis aurantiaca TaxID=72124 RepID=A0ACB8A2P4_9AGAM|nr:Leo1-like protein-domain-containing protein [Hygrophoropsis aurantiaca]
MSSLAGALTQPESRIFDSHSNPHGLATQDFHDYDVDMKPPTPAAVPNSEDSPALKEEQSNPQEDGNGDQEMEDLFGNDADLDETRGIEADVKSDSAPAATPAESGFESDDLSQSERDRRKALEYEELEEPPGVAEQVKEADVRIPNIPVPRSSNGEHWVIRMPNFVKVDSKPFHPDTYVGPEHDDDESHHTENVREKSMTIKLKVENTVRWRWIKDEFGQDRRQSNSRVIRWSDGSLSLRLGKELFDINQTIDTSGGVARQSLGGSQPSQASQTQSSGSQQPSSVSKGQGLTYLVAQHKRSEVLQAEAVITGYMTLRPTGMQSETHRMLVRAVGQKHNKVARLRMVADPTMDPEREKMELIKQSAKKSKKKVEDAGFGVRRKRASYSRKRAGHDVWSDDEEEPEYEASEDEDEAGGSRGAKRKEGDDQKKGPGEYQEDDFVVADESDDDGEFDGGRSKKKRNRDDEEEDPLDRMDAAIGKQLHERKRKPRDSTSGAPEVQDEDQDMDVESEEEEDEEHQVRKAGSGARKKRAIEIEEEEDD